jgi:hypothetical protein
MSASNITVIGSSAVYDGRLYLGELVALSNGQFRAIDKDGKRIGDVYDKRAEAQHAIWLASGRVGLMGAAP